MAAQIAFLMWDPFFVKRKAMSRQAVTSTVLVGTASQTARDRRQKLKTDSHETKAGKCRLTTNKAIKAAAPAASPKRVDWDRETIAFTVFIVVIAALLCCYFVLILRAHCKELFANICEQSVEM